MVIVKLVSKLFLKKIFEQMGSEKLKALHSVADGEVFILRLYPGPVSVGGRGTPCLRLINWVAIKYGIGIKLGRELLPAPAFAPVNAPFWGPPACFGFGLLCTKTNSEQTRINS
jgi:hypothetical protein